MRALRFVQLAQYAFWFCGTLLCGFAAGAWLEAHIYQAVESRLLDRELHFAGPRYRPPQNTSHADSAPQAAGSLVGRIEIPRVGLSAMVLEGSDDHTLNVGVGRLPQTAAPGQTGNVVLSGHRDTFFRPLRGVRRGDRIRLLTPDGPYTYLVEWTAVVDPEDGRSLHPTTDRSLTLVTCYPFRYLGPAPKRFIVRASQVAPKPRNPRVMTAASWHPRSRNINPVEPKRRKVRR